MIKRLHAGNIHFFNLQIDWRCEKIMSALDLYSSWYRAFVLHADWAMGIADFRVLPLADQVRKLMGIFLRIVKK